MKAIIFDMDGVIVDSEPHNLQILFQYVKSLRPETTIAELHQVVGRTKEDEWTRVADILGRGSEWERIRDDYEKNWKPYVPFPISYADIFRKETIEILKWARSMGMKTAVASSTVHKKVEGILTEVGVIPYLDLIVSGEFFEKSKPNPAIYLKTVELLEVMPEECIAIEDSTVGITAAHRAGVRVVALKDERFGFDRSLADDDIDNLSDFIDYYETYIK